MKIFHLHREVDIWLDWSNYRSLPLDIRIHWLNPEQAFDPRQASWKPSQEDRKKTVRKYLYLYLYLHLSIYLYIEREGKTEAQRERETVFSSLILLLRAVLPSLLYTVQDKLNLLKWRFITFIQQSIDQHTLSHQ